MYDLILKNGRVVDGSGGPWFRADIAVKDGLVVKIGKLGETQADMVIDANDMVVSPGFIDAHSHSDLVTTGINNGDSKITQGVTTEVAGMCGLTQAPVNPATIDQLKRYLSPFIFEGVNIPWQWNSLAEMLDFIDERGNSTNLAMLVGHGSVRIAAMGFDDREPTDEELEKMKKLVAESMEQGALGLSTGLIYPPGCYCKTSELIELCKVVAKYGGIYVTHMRNEGNEIIEAVKEALTIGRESGCPVHISHHKASGRPNHGKVKETLAMMEKAREEGVDVTCDAYPYTAGSTLISALLPKWVNAGGVEEMLKRLRDPETRNTVAKELEQDVPGWENLARQAGWNKILVSSCINNKANEGKYIQDIADERGVSCTDALFDIILEEQGRITMALFTMDEEDSKYVYGHRLSMAGSDGYAYAFSGPLAQGKPHPRSYGTFPRVLGTYVREFKAFPLETAVWKVTGFPAQRYGLQDRGLIKEGLRADFVVFNPDTIVDKSSYEDPFHQAEGIEYVILGGEVVVCNKEYSGKTLGKVFRRKS